MTAMPEEVIAAAGLTKCKIWEDVTHVVQRIEDEVVHSPNVQPLHVEVLMYTMKNAIVWAFQSNPSPLTTSQAIAWMHDILVKLHQRCWYDDSVIITTQVQCYYISLYGKCIEEFPSRAMEEFGYALAYCHLYENNLETANKLIEYIALYEKRDQDRIVLFKAWIAIKQEQYEHAVSILDSGSEAAKLTPTRAFWLAFSKFLLHKCQNKYSSIGEIWLLLQKAIAGEVKPVASLNLHSWFLFQSLGRLKSVSYVTAGESLSRAMTIDFNQVLSLYNYAMVMGRLEKWKELQQLLQYTTEVMANWDSHKQSKSPNHLRLYDSKSLTYVDVNIHLGQACIQNRDYRTARILIERLLNSPQEIIHQDPFKMQELFRDYVYILLESNAPQAALDACDYQLQRYQADNVLLLYKADALLMLERLQECEWTIQQLDSRLAIDDEPCHEEYIQLLNNHALVLACKGKTDEALVKLQECRQKYPTSIHAAYNMTILLWRDGKHVAACTIWRSARPDPPKNQLLSKIELGQHVLSGMDGTIAPQQIQALNRLIDSYWKDQNQVEAIKKSLRVVEHYADIAKGR